MLIIIIKKVSNYPVIGIKKKYMLLLGKGIEKQCICRVCKMFVWAHENT